MKYVRYLIVLLVLLVMASPMIVRADTFDFTFATVNGDFSGSGFSTHTHSQPIRSPVIRLHTQDSIFLRWTEK